jgi:hypothetical protein
VVQCVRRRQDDHGLVDRLTHHCNIIEMQRVLSAGTARTKPGLGSHGTKPKMPLAQSVET